MELAKTSQMCRVVQLIHSPLNKKRSQCTDKTENKTTTQFDELLKCDLTARILYELLLFAKSFKARSNDAKNDV